MLFWPAICMWNNHCVIIVLKRFWLTMKIIHTKHFPFGTFVGILLFGVLFWKGGKKPSESVMIHESIHERQMLEMLIIPFYLWYFVEWIVRLVVNRGSAYRSLSFEREAYANQNNKKYLAQRRPYSWIKYMNLRNLRESWHFFTDRCLSVIINKILDIKFRSS